MKSQRSSLDIISTLPQSIIETILCLVPIQDAVKTSILSRNWRYKWVKIPKLVFVEKDMTEESTDDDHLSILEKSFEAPSDRLKMTKVCKVFYAIYQVLLMHQGPIHEFTLSMHADDSCVEIDHIISHLSRNNTLKKFTLDISCEYRLPLSVFSLHHLTDLYLHNCNLYLQPTFNGFGSLTSLHLDHVKTSKKRLLHLLSNSPLLKSFTLIINEDYIIENDDSTIIDLFQCLSVIEHLTISNWVIACFAQDGVPQKLPTTLVHLKYFYVGCLCLIEGYGLPFVGLLIRSSPNLEKIKLRIFPELAECCTESAIDSFTVEDYSDVWLEHLNELEIECFTNLKPELELLKLILAKSPVLKKMRIMLHFGVANDEKLEMLKILLRSPRASPVVEIIVER